MMNLQEALNTIGTGGSTNYFTLKNHGDTETVRFLYGNNPEDIDWFPVYKVQINGKNRYVKMPDKGQPDPFPKYNYKPTLRGLLQLVKVDPVSGQSVDNSEVFVWDRGRTHIEQLAMLMNQIQGKNLCDVPVNITRIGAAGSTQTTYQMIPRLDLASQLTTNHARKTREEWAKDDSSFVLVLSYEDMVKVCEGTYQPPQQNQQQNQQQGNVPQFGAGMPPVGGQSNTPAFNPSQGQGSPFGGNNNNRTQF